jgi:hypothetical protein
MLFSSQSFFAIYRFTYGGSELTAVGCACVIECTAEERLKSSLPKFPS